ncbi:MAG TPA: hypothetical protein VMI56_17685 [Reyranella sp.]|nr:hypothetical protein [Reyranella sp.]
MRTNLSSGVAGFALLALAVGGCSSAPCTGNPATDSLMCVQQGINTGAYDRRVADARAEASEAQRRAADARAENERLQGQIADAQAQQQALRAKIAGQRRDLDQMSARIAKLQADGALSPGESSLQLAQLDYLRKRQQELAQSQAATRELQQKAAALQADIDALNAALAKVKG